MAKPTYILYARKSSESEDRQVQSIDGQIEVLEALAAKLGLTIVKKLSDSKSAKAPFRREGFSELLRVIENDEAQGILCWHINRLSRNPAESGMLQQMLQDEKIKIIQTHDRTYNPSDNAVVFSVEASIGNQFIIDLKKNVRRGIAHKIRHGGLSGVAPQGYLNIADRDHRTVVKDPKRFPLIRSAFDLLLTESYTVPQIRLIMNEDWGYTTLKRKKVGGGPISRSSMYHIFRNIRYAGQIPDPYKPGVYHKANFPQMITIDEYDRAQVILGKRGCPRPKTKSKFELRGFVRCGECGCMITAERKKKQLISGKVNYHTYYHCTGKRPCNQRGSIKEQDLFDQLSELLDSYELSPKLYEWGMLALNDMAKSEIKKRDDIQSMQFESIMSLQNKLDKLLDLATDGFITAEVYKEKSDILSNELKKRQREQTRTTERVKNWYEVVGNTLEVLTHATEKFSSGDMNEKANILMAIGQNPIIIDRKLDITPNAWLIPVRTEVKRLRIRLEKVRTLPDKIRIDSEMVVMKTWHPGQDSNLRP